MPQLTALEVGYRRAGLVVVRLGFRSVQSDRRFMCGSRCCDWKLQLLRNSHESQSQHQPPRSTKTQRRFAYRSALAKVSELVTGSTLNFLKSQFLEADNLSLFITNHLLRRCASPEKRPESSLRVSALSRCRSR